MHQSTTLPTLSAVLKHGAVLPAGATEAKSGQRASAVMSPSAVVPDAQQQKLLQQLKCVILRAKFEVYRLIPILAEYALSRVADKSSSTTAASSAAAAAAAAAASSSSSSANSQPTSRKARRRDPLHGLPAAWTAKNVELILRMLWSGRPPKGRAAYNRLLQEFAEANAHLIHSMRGAIAECSDGAVLPPSNVGDAMRCNNPRLLQALNASWTTAAAHVAADQGNCLSANAERIIRLKLVDTLVRAGAPLQAVQRVAAVAWRELAKLNARELTSLHVARVLSEQSGLRVTVTSLSDVGLPSELPGNIKPTLPLEDIIASHPNALMPALRAASSTLQGRVPKLFPLPRPPNAARAAVYVPLSVLLLLYNLTAEERLRREELERKHLERLHAALRASADQRSVELGRMRAELLRQSWSEAEADAKIVAANAAITASAPLPSDVAALLLPPRGGPDRARGKAQISVAEDEIVFAAHAAVLSESVFAPSVRRWLEPGRCVRSAYPAHALLAANTPGPLPARLIGVQVSAAAVHMITTRQSFLRRRMPKKKADKTEKDKKKDKKNKQKKYKNKEDSVEEAADTSSDSPSSSASSPSYESDEPAAQRRHDRGKARRNTLQRDSKRANRKPKQPKPAPKPAPKPQARSSGSPAAAPQPPSIPAPSEFKWQARQGKSSLRAVRLAEPASAAEKAAAALTGNAPFTPSHFCAHGMPPACLTKFTPEQENEMEEIYRAMYTPADQSFALPPNVRWLRARLAIAVPAVPPPATAWIYKWIAHRHRLRRHAADVCRRARAAVRTDVMERPRNPDQPRQRRTNLPRVLEADKNHEVYDVSQPQLWIGFERLFGVTAHRADLEKVQGHDPGGQYSMVGTNGIVSARSSSRKQRALSGERTLKLSMRAGKANTRTWIRKVHQRRLADEFARADGGESVAASNRRYHDLLAASGSLRAAVQEDLRQGLSVRVRVFKFYALPSVAAFDWMVERGVQRARATNITALASQLKDKFVDSPTLFPSSPPPLFPSSPPPPSPPGPGDRSATDSAEFDAEKDKFVESPTRFPSPPPSPPGRSATDSAKLAYADAPWPAAFALSSAAAAAAASSSSSSAPAPTFTPAPAPTPVTAGCASTAAIMDIGGNAAAPASSTSALNGKVIVGVGAWTPGQTSEKRGGPAGRGNPFDGSLQALVATLLVDLLILVLVCEYGTSSLCVWCTLYGDHKGKPENVKLTKLFRAYPGVDGGPEKRRQERVLYCSHCGRHWHRDEHGALAIRLNLLWLLRYGHWHPFYRPPWETPASDVARDFHQHRPVPLHNQA